MKKKLSSLIFCSAVIAAFWSMSIISDRIYLDQELIRMHIVANSDSEPDQNIKLQVRDAVCRSIETDLDKIQNTDEAMDYLRKNLPKLKNIADQVLKEAGMDMEATISLGKEAFPTRIYDTFRLPAGIYKTLRIILGDGNGENWWCVTFPALCMQETVSEYEEAAVCAGLPLVLTESLKNASDYELRFLALDFIGRITAYIYG